MVKDNKASFKEAESVLDEICIADIGEEYRIFLKSDDGGNHIVVAFEEQQPEDKQSKVALKLQLLSMSKEVLERNAALRWEQDKTKGLEVTVEEIIKEARKMIEFVLED